MNDMHLFAGAGGGVLGSLILGHTPIIAVEWDKYACSVLRERVKDGWFPDMQVYEGDARLFDPSEYAGRVDCIHAGLPCQDISVAGKQAGVGEDTRSGLYREVLRIADVVRPRELFMENVAAILSNGLGTVLADLSARGYSARWMCLRASDVGANHHRDRWWLLARRSDVSPHHEHSGIGRREQFAKGISEASDVGNTEHDGQLTKSELRGDEAASDERRAEESAASGQPTGADRPADVSGIRRSEGGEQPCEQYADMADTTSAGFSQRGQPRRSEGATEISAGLESEFERCGEDVSNAVGFRQSGSWTHEQPVNHTSSRDRKTDRTINICEARQSDRKFESSFCRVDDVLAFGMDANWYDIEPNVGRVTNVSKDRASQLKALGNGQVPLQMALAYLILQELYA